MFARIDFNFQLELPGWVSFVREAERQVDRMGCLHSLAGAKPRQSVANSINDWTVGLGPQLHEVDVFGVTEWRREEQFVECGSPAECDLIFQCRSVEQVTESTGDDEVLFDLSRIRPGGLRAPLLEKRKGNQESTSTGSATVSFHFEFVSTGAEVSRIGLIEGSSGLDDFACRTNFSKDFEIRSWPVMSSR